MKKLAKEIARLEGKRSESTIGNIREMLKVSMAIEVVNIVLERGSSEIAEEWCDQFAKMKLKADKKLTKTKTITRDELINYLLK